MTARTWFRTVRQAILEREERKAAALEPEPVPETLSEETADEPVKSPAPRKPRARKAA